jgi:hypothetical protein
MIKGLARFLPVLLVWAPGFTSLSVTHKSRVETNILTFIKVFSWRKKGKNSPKLSKTGN